MPTVLAKGYPKGFGPCKTLALVPPDVNGRVIEKLLESWNIFNTDGYSILDRFICREDIPVLPSGSDSWTRQELEEWLQCQSQTEKTI